MNTRPILIICLFLVHTVGYSQCQVAIGPGVAIPITGYGDVVKTGWLLGAEGKFKLKKHFTLGLKTQFTRLQKDKNANDAFQQARMTVAPLLITAEYGEFVKGNFQPYLTGGLGITFFNINYDNSSAQGTSINNVSFTMMPAAGARYAVSNNIYPFLETGLILIADGPPVGFPQGEKLTGYGFVSVGVHYVFN